VKQEQKAERHWRENAIAVAVTVTVPVTATAGAKGSGSCIGSCNGSGKRRNATNELLNEATKEWEIFGKGAKSQHNQESEGHA